MKEKNNKFKYSLFFFILFYSVCCFLSFNRHSKAEVFDYHSEIFSDKSGYYVYLPSLFIYNFQPEKLPPNIALKTGQGFSIDTARNKIFTKYTYGVALLQAPFFIVTHLLANRLGYPNNGFSWIYNKMIDIAGVFYADLAFIFLYFFLIRYVPGKIAFISLSCIFLGTNLFYYSIFETGMSHIYSFFLFSVFLYLSGLMFKPVVLTPLSDRQAGNPLSMSREGSSEESQSNVLPPSLFDREGPGVSINSRGVSINSTFLNIIFGLVIGLIIMVRPINVIFLPVFFMFNQPIREVLKRFLTLFIGRFLTSFGMTAIAIRMGEEGRGRSPRPSSPLPLKSSCHSERSEESNVSISEESHVFTSEESHVSISEESHVPASEESISEEYSINSLKIFFKPILIIAFSACIVTIPQLIYWNYLSGHFFMYAYQKEGFTNLLSPKLLSLWFSTNNGLVIYSPLVLLVLSGLIIMRKVYQGWSLFLAIYFIFISYIFSSWWYWSYGGGYGCRPFVEYYTLFSLPFCFLIKYSIERKSRLYLFGLLIGFCIAWNLKLIFSFDGYWYGGDWDWKGLYNFLISPTK